MARKQFNHAPTGHTILVVDDDLTILSTLERLLSRQGHQVLTASGGREAVQTCRNQTVHLMLLDYIMPDQNGEEVVRQVRAFDTEVQIVLQTGYASEHPARALLNDLEIQGYHNKAEGPEKLLLWVDVALRAYRQSRALRHSRDGLQYMLSVSLELNQLLPPAELMNSLLVRLHGLLGATLDTSGLRNPERTALHGLVVTHNTNTFRVQQTSGRFQGLCWKDLNETTRNTILEAARTRKPQLEDAVALPLVVGDWLLGVIAFDHPPGLGAELELLELFAHQAALAVRNAQLYQLATTDPLTGLARREHLIHSLEETLRLAHRYREPVSLIMLDIDHFKHLNDTHGHLAGDAALAAVGRCLLQEARASDVVGRFGGEEFAVLLPRTDAHGAAVIAERLCTAVQNLGIEWNDHHLALTASLGVISLNAQVDTHLELETTRDALLNAVDVALYAAKRNGRNRVAMGETLGADLHGSAPERPLKLLVGPS
jgi:diguanylate cyclase (GGDEF)-like protein